MEPDGAAAAMEVSPLSNNCGVIAEGAGSSGGIAAGGFARGVRDGLGERDGFGELALVSRFDPSLRVRSHSIGGCHDTWNVDVLYQ